jgi:hypothetical protein
MVGSRALQRSGRVCGGWRGWCRLFIDMCSGPRAVGGISVPEMRDAYTDRSFAASRNLNCSFLLVCAFRPPFLLCSQIREEHQKQHCYEDTSQRRRRETPSPLFPIHTNLLWLVACGLWLVACGLWLAGPCSVFLVFCRRRRERGRRGARGPASAFCLPPPSLGCRLSTTSAPFSLSLSRLVSLILYIVFACVKLF